MNEQMPPATKATPGSDREIRLNGAPHRVPAAMTLRELVVSIGCDPLAVAVEVNGEIVRRSRLAGTQVVAGDAIEIVRFVQGG
ncbi:MAG: sulfur carrier protein ThiS [Thermoanaerobaculia bacterium]